MFFHTTIHHKRYITAFYEIETVMPIGEAKSNPLIKNKYQNPYLQQKHKSLEKLCFRKAKQQKDDKVKYWLYLLRLTLTLSTDGIWKRFQFVSLNLLWQKLHCLILKRSQKKKRPTGTPSVRC
ncbi:hypothetical protein GJU40_06830 [Bacillus lacus]|uniref:Uncharacterized protein n=1 Tax=Metabacillus lacus TaxID=1983721 RepID=A0A7X2LY16_9BACI|nr:hypothetical protein [Metabacillus lacus]MRX71886.1 hypothetical protein [Metabacillus lacus]